LTTALVAFCLAMASALGSGAAQAASAERPLTLVAMDPLASPLACKCVEGYAQRAYEKFGKYLEAKLGRPVKVVFSEDLGKALRGDAGGKADLIVGKRSVVESDARECNLEVRHVAMLTGKDGSTRQHGLFVVRNGDPAKTIADLKGYTILFGPAEEAEKHQAAVEALKAAGIEVSGDLQTRGACSEAALDVVDGDGKLAAVISSYAKPLLEGCGTIKPGELRVVGKTGSVPFVTAFVTGSVDAGQEKAVLDALLSVRDDPAMLVILESKLGFVKPGHEQPAAPEIPGLEIPGLTLPELPGEAAPKATGPPTGSTWPGWRGPNRDGLAPWLPDRFPDKIKMLWRKRLTGSGAAGVAATKDRVIVADKSAAGDADVFRCLDAATGRQLWKLEYPAPGEMDYGNSPRATPLIHDGLVYLLGAFGDLHCVRLDDGKLVWRRNLARDFGARVVTWGYCSSPLLVGDKLIVNPGAPEASVAALNRLTGETVWATPGKPAAYASFIAGRFGGTLQIVGYDADSLGGWDIATGKRLWRLVPDEKGDFNVPTPIDLGGRLLVATENNGTRIYAFDVAGRIVPEPAARFFDLAPDSTTPVVIDGKVYGCWGGMFCLDADAGLQEVWYGQEQAFDDYVSLIGAPGRILVTTTRGELLLLRAGTDRYELISRARIFDEDTEVLSHPALVGKRLYVRDNTTIACVDLQN